MDNDYQNDHLNLFYSYNDHGCENNLTRALLIVLRNLSPVHKRIFIDRFFASAPPSDPLSGRDFPSLLQVYGLEEEDARLTPENGRIVGITRSGRQGPDLSDAEGIGDAIPDALFGDGHSGRTLLFEAKLEDTLDPAQLHRHFKKFFDPTGSLQAVFREVSWTYLVDILECISLHSDNSKERFLIEQLVGKPA
jgi:hypothetical protein